MQKAREICSLFKQTNSPNESRPSTGTSAETRTINATKGSIQILSDATITHSTDDDFGRGQIKKRFFDFKENNI